MSISISEKDGKIQAQADGQSAIPLEKMSDTQYKFDPAGIIIEFHKENNGDIPSFLLKQNGAELIFEK